VIALFDRELHDVSWLASWFTSKWAALSWSMLFTAVGAGIASLAAPQQYMAVEKRNDWLETSRDSLTKIPEHPFAQEPPPWSSPAALATVLIASTTFVLFRYFW